MVCKNMGYIRVFGSIVGPHYLYHMPTRTYVTDAGESFDRTSKT